MIIGHMIIITVYNNNMSLS